MAQDAQATITVPFEITSFELAPYDEPAEGLPMARGTVLKRFSGRLEATSRTEMLTAGEAGYVASERVEGTLDGRAGSFVLQHGGVDDGGEPRAFGHVVPGSGTGELRGLRGKAAYAHDEAGARLTLDPLARATPGRARCARDPCGPPSRRAAPAPWAGAAR